jgi:hypothetical protein
LRAGTGPLRRVAEDAERGWRQGGAMLLPVRDLVVADYDVRMKTSEATKLHREKVTAIVNALGDEYAAWYGWTTGFGRYVALGEYILEETEGDKSHDQWLMDARASFLKWKKDHHIETTPPANLRAE